MRPDAALPTAWLFSGGKDSRRSTLHGGTLSKSGCRVRPGDKGKAESRPEGWRSSSSSRFARWTRAAACSGGRYNHASTEGTERYRCRRETDAGRIYTMLDSVDGLGAMPLLYAMYERVEVGDWAQEQNTDRDLEFSTKP